MNRIKGYFKHFIHLIKYINCYIYCKVFKINNDNVWILSERGVDARDNGYHFFKYVIKEHPEINVKYVINDKSADFRRVQQLGETIQYGSWKHYVLFITAGKLISTHQMGFSPDGSLFLFLESKGLLKIRGKRVSLKHGITKDLIKINTKLDLLICGAYPEYCFFRENYQSIKEIFKYTGFARYDSLYNELVHEKKQILLMPTFRSWLIHLSKDEFLKSNYFQEYNRVLNNKKLLEVLEKYNCELVFYPHFEIQKWIYLFNSESERVKIASFKEYDVQELLRQSALLVTDFSSVFFDFAYMNKPMVFYQFDTEEYRKMHYKKGYFEYTRDGFGEVLSKEDETINEIERIIKNEFKIDDKYRERISKFFRYNDKNNCKRIFEEINRI